MTELLDSALTCQQCRHFHRTTPAPIQAVDNRTGSTIQIPKLTDSGPVIGECRSKLHHMVLQDQRGGMGMKCYYPSLPATFAACGEFQEKAGG